mgnify:CR=1 FL=1
MREEREMSLARNANVLDKKNLEYMKSISLSIIFSVILAVGFATTVQAQATFPKGELSIKTTDSTYDFDIELALDDSHRQYGMMFRTEMPEMSGMLFVYDRKRDLSMWMKNTFISLDILFIDTEGKIINITKSAQPRSLSLISSKRPSKAVLELKGGITDKLGIEVGDEIIHSTFENTAK